MVCEHCGGEVIWMGPLTALTHTQCKQCGGINCQEVAFASCGAVECDKCGNCEDHPEESDEDYGRDDPIDIHGYDGDGGW